MTNPLLELKALGQSVWLDDIDREQLLSGQFQRLIDEDGLSGATGNPTRSSNGYSAGRALRKFSIALVIFCYTLTEAGSMRTSSRTPEM